MSLLIIRPVQDRSYQKAVDVFVQLCEKATGISLQVGTADDGKSDLVVIGSDAVNDFLMQEIFEKRVSPLNIRYGTDDYQIRSYAKEKRKVLILAGGRLRSTLYAVYDYFERYLGCHYFWDGDVIPAFSHLPMENIDERCSPRFEYRGLRYFAHRGLHRFQAEHWSLEDWKAEMDWLVKKRLNFFMLRIGMDDVWQRAFPDAVPYPESYQKVRGADASGYNDRSDFWTLKYRGILRERVLEYARSLDLSYPTDCGTMTHWYSRTPQEFLKAKNPVFAVQEETRYSETDTGKVFDFTKKENMDYYMKLTETMVEEYDKNTCLFHTIGLGERRMYRDPEKNFALKRFAYRRISERIKRRYPGSKLLLASWDLWDQWTPEEVQGLVSELDPESHMILDYTSEGNEPVNNFQNWGVVGKFPWIFGLFHAFESESEIRGPYDLSNERLKVAAADPFCKGMVLWPELSHSDPLILEYLSENAWSPLKRPVEEILESFCQKRYGADAERMNCAWQHLLPLIKLGSWGGDSNRFRKERGQNSEHLLSRYTHVDVWTRLSEFLHTKARTNKNLLQYQERKIVSSLSMVSSIVLGLKELSKDKESLKKTFVLRDSADLARTVLSRFLNYHIFRAVLVLEDKKRLFALKESYLELLDLMAQLLSVNGDLSLYRSFQKLAETAPVNPDFELTLKRNIHNSYCNQGAYELVQWVFKEEGRISFDWLLGATGESVPDFLEKAEAISRIFFETPLSQMQPERISDPAETIGKIADAIERAAELLR